MKHLIVVLAIVWGLFQLSGWIMSSKRTPPHELLARVTELPPRHITDPYRNAYFFLLGFASAATSDPVKTGYDMWVETADSGQDDAFDYQKPGRSELHIESPLLQVFPSWNAEDPLAAFRSKEVQPFASSSYQTLLSRYARCLDMPFEDWGYERRAVPNLNDVAIIHRLYVAEGFSRSTNLGLERLRKEMNFWRTVLREANTISLKVAAQFIIQDDAYLVSRILSKPTVDKTVLTTGLQLMLPLSDAEYSLRWPIRHQVFLAIRQSSSSFGRRKADVDPINHEEQWLALAAHLPAWSFQRIDHPNRRSGIRSFVGTPESWDVYAAYYDVLIKASDTRQSAIPSFQEFADKEGRGLTATLLAPTRFEPQWEPFFYLLMETDARLRLTSLQIQLRRPVATISVPVRLAEVGSQYFDPFTGLPMLWSPTQHLLYSVGKDRLDDGGDPSFDIVTPPLMTSSASPSIHSSR